MYICGSEIFFGPRLRLLNRIYAIVGNRQLLDTTRNGSDFGLLLDTTVYLVINLDTYKIAVFI